MKLKPPIHEITLDPPIAADIILDGDVSGHITRISIIPGRAGAIVAEGINLAHRGRRIHGLGITAEQTELCMSLCRYLSTAVPPTGLL